MAHSICTRKKALSWFVSSSTRKLHARCFHRIQEETLCLHNVEHLKRLSHNSSYEKKSCLLPLSNNYAFNRRHRLFNFCTFNLERDCVRKTLCVPSDSVSSQTEHSKNAISYLDAQDKDTFDILSKDMTVYVDFLSEEEEASLLAEVDRYMKRLRYEFSHWDNAIHGYRETEKKNWNVDNAKILERVKDLAFTSDVAPLAFVHVLDIVKEGYIKPHVDAVRFCGDTIAGMCLISSCVMRLARENDASKFADIYLPRRSLYIMKGRARYEYTHEVLKEEESFFKGQEVPRDRRISVICRNESRQNDAN